MDTLHVNQYSTNKKPIYLLLHLPLSESRRTQSLDVFQCHSTSLVSATTWVHQTHYIHDRSTSYNCYRLFSCSYSYHVETTDKEEQ